MKNASPSSRRAALLTLAIAVVLTRLWFSEHWSHFNNIPRMFALAAPRNLAVCLLAIVLLSGIGARAAPPSSRSRRRAVVPKTP